VLEVQPRANLNLPLRQQAVAGLRWQAKERSITLTILKL
jgi:hypothetical protein